MAVVAWGAKVSRAFVEKVEAIAADLGCKPDYLMACMAFESAETFSSAVRNPLSGATGLIQFMSRTAKDLGTSLQALAAMTPEDQLDFVAMYFAPYKGRLQTLDDVYMVILWPAGVGKPSTFVLFAEGSKAYLQNKGFDVDHDGKITKAECAARVRQMLVKGQFYAGEGNDVAPIPRPRPVEVSRGELSAADIRHAQEILHDLKFYEVGEADGTIGSRTVAAIAAFKCERELVGEPVLDRELLAALVRAQDEGWVRPISDARAEGEPEGSRIVASTERQATVTTTTGGTIVTGGILAWLSQKVDAVQQLLAPLTPYVKPFAHLLLEYWWAFLGAGLAYFLLEQAHVRRARVEDHREGKTT